MATMEVIPAHRSEMVRAEDFMPLMTVEQAIDRKKQINKFIAGVMTEGEDYGKMPGGQQKKVLLKPGAEKLSSIFGLAPQYEAEQIIEDWTGGDHGGEPLFYYRYRCRLYRGDRCMGEAVGSCNSWEVKYRYRWMGADQIPAGTNLSALQSKGSKRTLFEPFFAYDKRETTGQYGKPVEHWDTFDKAVQDGSARRVTKQTKAGKDMTGWEIDIDATVYRIPNPDSADAVNTCQKMAQKRALVAAVLIVTNCSDAFTQDLEDSEPIDTGGHPVGTQAAADHVAQTKLAGGPLPKELAGALAAIDKNIGAFQTVCNQLSKLIGDKHGAAGIKDYDELVMKFSEQFPNGCKNTAPLKQAVRDMWDIFQRDIKKPTEHDAFDMHMKSEVAAK